MLKANLNGIILEHGVFGLISLNEKCIHLVILNSISYNNFAKWQTQQILSGHVIISKKQ